MVKIERTNGENAKIAVASLEKEKQKKVLRMFRYSKPQYYF